jgi:hypothetical protein
MINRNIINKHRFDKMNNIKINNQKFINRETTSYLKPCQFNIIWHLSWLSLSSSMYAMYKGHYNLAFIPGGVFLTSINYWKKPALSSWERTLDVGYVNMALLYQLYSVYKNNAENAKEYYFFTGLSMMFYPIGLYYYKKKQYWKHIIFHSGLHIFANIANFILYTGNPF